MNLNQHFMHENPHIADYCHVLCTYVGRMVQTTQVYACCMYVCCVLYHYIIHNINSVDVCIVIILVNIYIKQMIILIMH